MTLKPRRFSLDSSIGLDGVGPIGGRRGSSMFSSKKSRHSLDDARLEIHELNHSLNNNVTLRTQTIAEENLDQSDGLFSNHGFLKYNKSFHKLFQEIPMGESLTHAFTCALQKEVLYHGKLFVSDNYVCFYSSVLLKDTKVVIPASSVREVKKHNSALSMLSIQTADGEKEKTVSPLSSAENEADHEMASSYSSLEDCADHDLSRQDSIYLDNSFHQMSSEDPTRYNSTHQSSLADEDDRAALWIWRIIERVTPFFLLREIQNFSSLFFLYLMLTVLLLLASGYIGLRIMALEEQLQSLGALTELTLHHREYQET
uniref:GRAM domain-containing protein n=1 Tax=Dicentrarchus labrax TaxID=13489 RepID=A0A8C4NWE1_DICLA